MHNPVNESMILQEFGSLKPWREILVGCFLDHTRSGESYHAFGFCQNEIPQRSEACHNSGGGRMGDNRDVRLSSFGMTGERSACLSHLHQAKHPLIHPSTSGGGK